MPPCVTLVTLPCVHEFMFHASSHLRLIDRSILRLLMCATNQLKAAEHKYEKGKPRKHGDTERHEEVADHCVAVRSPQANGNSKNAKTKVEPAKILTFKTFVFTFFELFLWKR